MDIGFLQAMIGNMQQLPTSNNKLGEVSNELGVSFEDLLIGEGKLLVSAVREEEITSESSLGEMIQAILNASSLEELAELMGNENINQEPLQFMHLNLGEILEQVTAILEKLINDGAKESELIDVEKLFDSSPESNLWTLLTFINENPSQFFEQLTESLEGKGAISQGNALELLVIFKSITIAAPKTDLTLNQEQQLFTLDRYLTAAGAQLESLPLGNDKQQITLKFPEVHHSIKVVETPMTQQGMSESESKEEGKSTTQSNLNFQQLTGARSAQLFSEVTPKAEVRSEALIREMQAIFKRSNFGQVGGTNRLLINLNPAHLGKIRVELLHADGVLTARILASTALGKEMIDSQLNQLRAAFLQQNIQVDRIDVSQTLQDTPRHEKEHSSFQQQSGKDRQNNDSKEQQENEQDEMTFQEHMIELEV